MVVVSTLGVVVEPAGAGVGGGIDYATIPFDPANFPHATAIDNPYLSLVPGTQLVLQGEADRGGGRTPHRVIFTVTDLTKVVAGVRAVVVWDQDVNAGLLRESELALFAQARDGNVWNLGEYPEEMANGMITGTPSTWLSGKATALGGVHVHGTPVAGPSIYLAGSAPAIQFLDVAKVDTLQASTCAPVGCFDNVLLVDEWDPLAQPDDGHQYKYYAPGVGLTRIEALGGIEQERLVRVEFNHLTAAEMDDVRAASKAIDSRSRANSQSVWKGTAAVEQVTVPGASLAVSASLSAGVADAVTVVWAPPTSDGNAVVTGYTVTASPGGAVRAASVASRSVTFDGLTQGVEYRFAVTASNIVGAGPSATSNAVTIPLALAPPPPAAPGGFSALEPARLVDTRNPGGRTIDGVLAGAGAPPAGLVTEVVVAGRGGVPFDAAAVGLNVTAVAAQAAGYLTVWPCGGAMPNASNLNFAGGATIANMTLVKVGAGGKICVFAEVATDLIIDVAGYFPAGASFVAIDPTRFVDTRAPGGRTIDGAMAAIGARVAGSVTEIAVGGRAGVPGGVSAVALNVTVSGAQAAGYLTVWPCGGEMPNVSNLNFAAGATVANSGLVQVDDGKVCVFSEVVTDVIVDVTGYFPAGSTGFAALRPGRVIDSRKPGGRTIDGTLAEIGVREARSVTEIVVGGRVGVPADAVAVALNVTVVGALAGGYVTVWPCGSPMPNASNLNFAAGATVANSVLVKVGAGGKVCVFADAATDLIADVAGYFTG